MLSPRSVAAHVTPTVLRPLTWFRHSAELPTSAPSTQTRPSSRQASVQLCPNSLRVTHHRQLCSPGLWWVLLSEHQRLSWLRPAERACRKSLICVRRARVSCETISEWLYSTGRAGLTTPRPMPLSEWAGCGVKSCCCCLYRNASTRHTAYRLNAPTRETYLLWQVPQTALWRAPSTR